MAQDYDEEYIKYELMVLNLTDDDNKEEIINSNYYDLNDEILNKYNDYNNDYNLIDYKKINLFIEFLKQL